MARRAKSHSRKRRRQTHRRPKAAAENPSPPVSEALPGLPIDPETGLVDWHKVRECRPPNEWQRLSREEEEWWTAFVQGQKGHSEAGRILDYYNAVRDGLIKPQHDKKKGSEPKSAPQPKPKTEPGRARRHRPQEARAMASLVKAFPPDGIAKNKSAFEARKMALRHLPPDPNKGPPSPDVYESAIKKLRRRASDAHSDSAIP
jgi:hypothetical protein